MNTFSERLRYAREQRKFSQAALAHATGLSQGAISSYETGNRHSTKGIFKLAQVLNVNVTWLSLGTGPMEIQAHQAVSPSSQHVGDVIPTERLLANHWPFHQLREADFWALSESQRDIIDGMVAALVKLLEPK
ncbi:helix-turn-helix transcriptional regulator [Alcaligenaceae bacterium]|nr:helix-turn-helix transcriptional regulator [Alcaligenaceae bacterium]